MCPAGKQPAYPLRQNDRQMKALQKKLDRLETKSAKQAQDAQEIEERTDKAELHTATDKLSLGVDFRTRAESIHYDNIRITPLSLTDMFFVNCTFKTESLPINLSLGRRFSTVGPPLEYRNNRLEGGSPLATIINWQPDQTSVYLFISILTVCYIVT